MPAAVIIGLAFAVAVAVTFVIIAATGGDGGTQRGSSPSGAFVGPDLHSLVAFDDGRIYVGGHNGVAISRDHGRTWRQVETLANADAMGWGQQQDAVFVSGHPGLNRSDDDGVSFRRINEGLPDTDMHSFGAGRAVLYGAGPNLGVVASTDRGQTWAQRSAGTGQAFFGRMIVDSADDDHVIAADARVGPVESRDGGRTWQSLGGPPATWLSSPHSGRTLFASGGGTAVRSTDGGGTWTPMRLPTGAQLLEAVPGNATKLFAAGLDGTNAKLWSSTDGGVTWAAA
jgi:photosystem II stability/assembly factor-like uncharacterized protein